MGEEVVIHTGRPEFDGLYPLVRRFLSADALDVVVDGKPVRGYRSPDARSIWVRDLSGFRREDCKSDRILTIRSAAAAPYFRQICNLAFRQGPVSRAMVPDATRKTAF